MVLKWAEHLCIMFRQPTVDWSLTTPDSIALDYPVGGGAVGICL